METSDKRSGLVRSRWRGWLAGLTAVLSLGLGPVVIEGVAAPSEAHAVVGRPLTPVSYAGVARRTSRRTTRRVASRQAAMYSLPAGCVLEAGVYRCGGTSYEQVIDGGTVVYVEAGD